MAAPTLDGFQTSLWNTTNTINLTSVSWSTGSVVVVVGILEDNGSSAFSTPTVAGLTFSSVQTTNTASNCKVYIWAATAGSASSGAIQCSRSATGHAGACVFSYSGTDGLGASALMASTSTTNATQSLTRTGSNSAVICAFGDWTPVNDTAVTTNPSSGGTVRVINFDSGHYSAYVGSWTDQGAPGTTSYGIANYTATPKWIGAVVEVKGTADAFLPTPNRLVRQAIARASYY